jgi:hypothetical protein
MTPPVADAKSKPVNRVSAHPLIILAHPNEVEDMTFWRAGVESGKKPKWDFVP